MAMCWTPEPWASRCARTAGSLPGPTSTTVTPPASAVMMSASSVGRTAKPMLVKNAEADARSTTATTTWSMRTATVSSALSNVSAILTGSTLPRSCATSMRCVSESTMRNNCSAKSASTPLLIAHWRRVVSTSRTRCGCITAVDDPAFTSATSLHTSMRCASKATIAASI